uniref:Uncharacterized protein n=1 Tax=Amphimedon queenslandica TaxID=400682 RepID=A0A1X7UB95_AMPQE
MSHLNVLILLTFCCGLSWVQELLKNAEMPVKFCAVSVSTLDVTWTVRKEVRMKVLPKSLNVKKHHLKHH